MLSKQLWMRLSQDMKIAWQQAMDEGKDVAAFQSICETIQEHQESRQYENLADAVYKQMQAAPLRSDYSYIEPSDLDGIRAARPNPRHSLNPSKTNTSLSDAIEGAWVGRIAGCLLGKPIESWRTPNIIRLLQETNNYPMKHFILRKDFSPELIKELEIDPEKCWADQLNGFAPVDDDTNYTVLGLKLIEEYGLDFTPDNVLEAWLSWLPLFPTCTAERVAYRNAAMGLLPPQTAITNNPYREWIGAQIRGDFFGYLNVSEPRAAAEMAWRDASISHIKNGIYGEMWIAAMLAAAPHYTDTKTIIETGLDEIPQNCRLREKVEQVIKWYTDGQSAMYVTEKIHEMYDEKIPHDWCHTISNAMIVAMGLLYGNCEFGTSICLAVQCGFDTDCNGATIGSIMGMMLGKEKIPDCWSEPFTEGLCTSIPGNDCVKIESLVKRTIQLIEKRKKTPDTI